MIPRQGGCLCGSLRYHVTTSPDWVTVCYCGFCQRATGTQGLVEPIFPVAAFAIIHGTPGRYVHVSAGSGKDVTLHFCRDCGTRTHLTFERWPDRLGVYSGSFDDPGWFEMSPANTRFIFLDNAVRGTLVPAGYDVFRQHSATPEGDPLEPGILTEVLHIR